MNTTELETAVRETCAIGDASAYPDYTQARILRELDDKQRTAFEDVVVKTQSGYWLHEKIFSATIGKNRYRMPPRAVVGGLYSLAINDTTNGAFYEIEQVPTNDLPIYEGTPGRAGQPIVYTVIGDQIEMVPTPSTVFQIKFTYYIRPSKLVPQQSSSIGGTVRGLISNVNTSTRVLTITGSVMPFDQSLATPATITSGLQLVDIVHADGWHELAMVDVPQTFSAGFITLGGTDDMSDVQVGDFVRVADQTDWPCLPDDFHRCLVDAAGVKMLIELHLGEKAQLLAANNGNDITRFRDLLYPRVKTAPKQFGIMRRSRGLAPFGRLW